MANSHAIDRSRRARAAGDGWRSESIAVMGRQCSARAGSRASPGADGSAVATVRAFGPEAVGWMTPAPGDLAPRHEAPNPRRAGDGADGRVDALARRSQRAPPAPGRGRGVLELPHRGL